MLLAEVRSRHDKAIFNLLRDEPKLHTPLGILRPLTDIKSLPLKLDDIPLLTPLHLSTRQRLDPILGLGVDNIREVIVLLELLLGNEVIVLDERDGNERVLVGRSREPCDFFGSLFEVAGEVEFQGEGGYG